MENKLTKIRRTFAAQLTGKHKLKLIIPHNDSSDSIFEVFINEMFNQLHRKRTKQDEELLRESNRNSPLFIQRKQLQKDIEDFLILNKRQDARAVQEIIERVERMTMLNRKYDIREVKSISQLNTQYQSTIIPTVKMFTVSCSYRALCSELLERFDWPSELFASEYDRCFCKTCYPLTMPNVYQSNIENKYPIIIPRNWMKFGLKIDEVQAKIHQIWDKWAMSYHGTLPNAALSMIKHRQICLPGDKLLDGTHLTIRPGHIPDQKAFFTSPTIRYAAQNHYATPLEFTSQIDKCVYTAKIVLRCRQMPGSFTIQGETLNNSRINGADFCDIIPDEQIEWKTDKRGTVIFDGLCVRLTPVSNQTFHNTIYQSHANQTNVHN
ncbi:unnamed protein product [Rotaria socialis]|uniref:Uncharacterized protein n=1 Tax=Rotaria socialis TaxID=392032 RepID=A0A821PAQ1_9BILA|nr:unnamed protein product [Rotaria socialis]CAF3392929.1 unnamed protein product [Rotaria socialis]CAF3425951.1 unnamed protein product [Rotaria socialis]CAF3472375.1 unnamed protein product [Rotaria socialis]CAF4337868.1 unnamed protein product [Rotaria socialis]